MQDYEKGMTSARLDEIFSEVNYHSAQNRNFRVKSCFFDSVKSVGLMYFGSKAECMLCPSHIN